MPGLLAHLSADFDRRLELRRRMLARLGIAVRADLAAGVTERSRDTLRACTSCHVIDSCEDWFESGAPGQPRFCSGRHAFEALSRALEMATLMTEPRSADQDRAPGTRRAR